MSTEAASRAEAKPLRLHADSWFRRTADAATLRAHGLAIRFDQVPTTFGDEAFVDEGDAAQVRHEWLRQLRVWADCSPEEVFTLKAGALMLGGVLALLLVVIAVV